MTFNPKAVLEYPIVGHEAGEWAGMLPGAVEADFCEGQAATGLFELPLRAQRSSQSGRGGAYLVFRGRRSHARREIDAKGDGRRRPGPLCLC